MKIVLTGAPGSGKSTLIRKLAEYGEQTVTESAIQVIHQLIDEMGLTEQDHWRRDNTFAFQQRVLQNQKKLEAQLNSGARAFLDRGATDGLAYLRMNNIEIPEPFLQEADGFKYDQVILVEPLPNLDLREGSGRNDTQEEAEQLVVLLKAEYERLGYEVKTLPPLPIKARVERLLEMIA